MLGLPTWVWLLIVPASVVCWRATFRATVQPSRQSFARPVGAADVLFALFIASFLWWLRGPVIILTAATSSWDWPRVARWLGGESREARKQRLRMRTEALERENAERARALRALGLDE